MIVLINSNYHYYNYNFNFRKFDYLSSTQPTQPKNIPDNSIPNTTEVDRLLEITTIYKVTDYKNLSTTQFKLDKSGEFVSGLDMEKLGGKYSFYPTFGTKYPYTEAVEDTTTEEVTTERIDVEDLEKQLLDVLDQMSNRYHQE